MRKITLTKLEQETIINYNNAEETATVYTHDGALIRKLNSKSLEFAELKIIRKDEETGFVEYSIPKKWLRIGFPRKSTMTEEQRIAAAERMKNARARKRKTQEE